MQTLHGNINNFYHSFELITAFDDIGRLNAGLPVVLGTVINCDIRFYTADDKTLEINLVGINEAGAANFAAANSVLETDPAGRLALSAQEQADDLALLKSLDNSAITLLDVSNKSIFQYSTNDGKLIYLVVNTLLDEAEQEFVGAVLKVYGNQVLLLNRAVLDSLTNLLNRQALDEKLDFLYSRHKGPRRRSQEASLPGCLALVDIDHFKQVNDTYGHLAGDDVLVKFAQLMRETFRDDDVLCRYGGEEFLVILSGVGMEVGQRALQRFLDRIHDTDFPEVGKVTASIGCTELDLRLPPKLITARADKALYYAKDNGRNRLCNFENLVELELLSPDPELLQRGQPEAL